MLTIFQLLHAILVVGLIAPSSMVGAADYQEFGAIGRWRFVAALDSSDVASLDDREAQQLVGRIFTVNKDHVKFGKRDCGPPELEAELVEPTLTLPLIFFL